MDSAPTLLLSPEEAAQLLGLSRSRVYELLRDAELPSIKIGRLRRIPRQAVHAYVAGLMRSDDSAAQAVEL